MNRLLKYTLGLLLMLAFVSVEAKEGPRKDKRKTSKTVTTYRDQCQKARAQKDMQINNVRAKLLTGGDLWWDGTNGKYIVPKPKPGSDAPEISSLYAGGIWIGGKDKGGNLKVAASTFPRSNSIDYYTGPLDPETGETELDICQNWDRFFQVTGKEIDLHIIGFESGDYDCSSIPDGVKYWPAKGNPYFTEKYDFALPNTGQGLAGFYDADGSGTYDPCQGDYPVIEIRGCPDPIYPDDMWFWIYNDKGGPHTESFGKPIQMEVQVQAFAFVSNDEINDMTFYRYKLINRAIEDISDTYFAMWIDPDLGCSTDDYIGCDTSGVSRTNKLTGEVEIVGRDLMYVYNEDAVDGTTGTSCSGVPTYEFDVPILGVDYFRGPLRPYTWKEVEGERILVPTVLGETSDTTLEVGMSAFMYLNGGGDGVNPNTTDPDVAEDYYNYMLGLWKDGTPLTYGGTGYNIGSTDTTRFAFPSDPSATTSIGNRDPWSMCSEALPAGDRRTLQVTGPLLLQPGAKNELIIGAVWVPHIDYPCPDLSKLLYADGLSQALFDNCFDRLEGPSAPEMCGIELDKELILVITNDSTDLNNNAFEKYEEVDIFSENLKGDSLYRFEGYKIFQLIDANVSVQELDDVERARLVRQVDIKNDVECIYNWTALPNPNGPDDIWSYKEMVCGADKGLNHTFQIKFDAFAEGDNVLINHKKYHFLVLAYAHNDKDIPFDPINPQIGQRKPYIEGVKNIKVLTLVPRPIVYQNMNSFYGDGPEITRISGVGVGNNEVDLRDDMHEKILKGELNGDDLVYASGRGPIKVKIYDPLNVKDGKYRLEIIGGFNSSTCTLNDDATWILTNLDTGEEIASEHTLVEFSEQVLGEVGITITVGQVADVGALPYSEGNGVISANITYADPSGDVWFFGMNDTEARPSPIFDFIPYTDDVSNLEFDPKKELSTIGDGFFTPFFMAKFNPGNPGETWYTPGLATYHNVVQLYTKIGQLNNVDVVLTSNKENWSRCVVVERSDSRYSGAGCANQGLAGQFNPRDADSVDKDGNPDGTGKGMGYFPGYAIDVETGERLNIFFGENSSFGEQHRDFSEFIDGNPVGADMIFNPTSQVIVTSPDNANSFDQCNLMMGGEHVIYVTRQPYDKCAEMFPKLKKFSPNDKAKGLSAVTWQAIAIIPPDMKMKSIADGLIPNDVTIKLRVNNPYSREEIFALGKRTCKTKDENPVYEFELKGKAPSDIEKDNYADALANVNVVPNPYYGFSAYEFTQYSTTVKITNVPAKATVTIYTLDGKFIKQFKRNEIGLPCGTSSNPGIPHMQITPDIEWNLKNSKGIPVASGVYLIHISAPDLGEERTIKWFGVSRKFDPSGL